MNTLRESSFLFREAGGGELPGMFSPMLVTEPFKELSLPWSKIVESHIQEVWKAICLSLSHFVTHVADSTTVKAILVGVLEPKLDSLQQTMPEKLLGLL